MAAVSVGERGRQTAFDVALLAAIGAAAGDLTVAGLFGADGLIAHPSGSRWLVFSVVVLFAAFVSARFVEAAHDVGGGWRLRGLVTGILAGASVHALASFAESPENLGVFLAALPIPLATTYFWIRGAHARPTKSALYGGLSAAAVACVTCAVLLVTGVILNPALREQLSPGAFHPLVLAVGLVLTCSLAASGSGLIGFLGGLAVDRRWGAETTRSVALIIGATLILESAMIFAFVQLLFHVQSSGVQAPPSLRMDMTNALEVLADAAGWGLALVLNPHAERLLRPQVPTAARG